MQKEKRAALLRATIAVVAAFAILWATGFAAVTILRGPRTVQDGDELSAGEYITTDLIYIMDVCGVEKKAADVPVGYYAVAPVGNKFVIVRFPASDRADIEALESATMAFMRGEQTSVGFHMIVSGTSRRTTEEESALLERWFSENGTWMSRLRVISAVDDYSTYLSDVAVSTGYLGSLSFGAAYALSGLAVALLLYAVAELVLAGLGRYDKKKDKKAWDPDV